MLHKMKLAVLLCVLVASEVICFYRVSKVECGSSRKTASNVRCYLRAYNRKNPLINAAYTLNRKVVNGKVC